MASVQAIYVALFGRPADPLGLDFYNAATGNGDDLDSIGPLSGSAEYQARIAGLSGSEIINMIYRNLFGREAEPAGLDFYLGLLNSGAATLQDIAVRIIDGAREGDLETLENKVEAANRFTEAVRMATDGINDYEGEDAADAGRAYLAGVGAGDDTIPTEDEAAAAVEGLGPPDEEPTPAPTPRHFTLTAGVDHFTGASANDRITGVLSSDGQATLQDLDRLDGRGGTDTLNLTVLGSPAFPVAAAISNIEIINLFQAGGLLDDGEQAIDFTNFGAAARQIWQIDAATDIASLANGQVAGFRDADVSSGITVAYQDAATKAFVALDGAITNAAGGPADLAITGTGLKTITVSGRLGDNDAGAEGRQGDLALQLYDGGMEHLETIILNLKSDVTLGIDGENFAQSVTRIDASGSTGGITAQLVTTEADTGGPFALETVLAGSGADHLVIETAAFTADAVVIDAGAGADTISLGFAGADAGFDIDEADTNTAFSVTLGAGHDTLIIGNSMNIADASRDAFESGIITITDFKPGEDFLEVHLGGPPKELSAENVMAINGQESLYDALLHIVDSDITTEGHGYTFGYRGSTYLYSDHGVKKGSFDAGDGLVKLAGVSIATLRDSGSWVVYDPSGDVVGPV